MQRIAVALLLAAAGGLAQTEEAHEHGVGRLNLVLEGEELHLELISPGANIVGFEHRPTSAEDKHTVEEAVSQLEDGDGLFELPTAAGCRLADANIVSELLGKAHDSPEVDKHGEGEEEHSGHEEGEHEDESHSEFHAEYRFSCTNPEALDRISVGVFQQFPATEELEVQVISPRGQTARELTASDPVIEL
jgi:hypothetical protein